MSGRRDERGRFRRCACWCHGFGLSRWHVTAPHKEECSFPRRPCGPGSDENRRVVVTYSGAAASNISTMAPTMWWNDTAVTVTEHVYRGVLPDGSVVDHRCDGTACRLPEELIEAMARLRIR